MGPGIGRNSECPAVGLRGGASGRGEVVTQGGGVAEADPGCDLLDGQRRLLQEFLGKGETLPLV